MEKETQYLIPNFTQWRNKTSATNLLSEENSQRLMVEADASLSGVLEIVPPQGAT